MSPSATLATSPGASTTAMPSPSVDAHLLSVLQQTWAGYKQGFISADGRVSDPTRGGITTSEGKTKQHHLGSPRHERKASVDVASSYFIFIHIWLLLLLTRPFAR